MLGQLRGQTAFEHRFDHLGQEPRPRGQGQLTGVYPAAR
jgi:hypothetical protein